MEPRSPALGVWNSSHCTTREVPDNLSLNEELIFFIVIIDIFGFFFLSSYFVIFILL